MPSRSPNMPKCDPFKGYVGSSASLGKLEFAHV